MFLLSAAAFGTCIILHLIALKLFPKLGLLDYPERYGLTRKRIPYPTGILAILTFLGFFIALQPIDFQAKGLIIGILLLLIVSFIDDRTPLPWWVRLGAQMIAAFLIFATGSRIYTITNPLEGIMGIGNLIKLDTIDIGPQFSIFNFQFSIPFGPLPLWSGVFTILWLGLTINALNWFDGIPGQVSTISVIGFLTIGFLAASARVEQPELAIIAFILAGIAAGCLVFDFPPNKVLMGDSGAMFFGLMLGVLTIYAGGKVATGFLVLGIPIIDSVIVIVRRITKGHSPYRGSMRGEHLHHRLLTKGWSPHAVIGLTAALGTLFGITALFLSTREKFAAGLILFAIMIGLSYYSRPK